MCEFREWKKINYSTIVDKATKKIHWRLVFSSVNLMDFRQFVIGGLLTQRVHSLFFRGNRLVFKSSKKKSSILPHAVFFLLSQFTELCWRKNTCPNIFSTFNYMCNHFAQHNALYRNRARASFVLHGFKLLSLTHSLFLLYAKLPIVCFLLAQVFKLW